MRGGLQGFALEADAIVPPDGTLVMFAEDVPKAGADERDEGAPCDGGWDGEFAVEGGLVVVAEVAIGGLDGGDALRGEFFGQALLVGGEHAFSVRGPQGSRRGSFRCRAAAWLGQTG